MSIKRKYEMKAHIVTEKVVTSEKRYCDFCGKEITEHYWDLETCHSDWSNDSCDSIEHHDVCSPECLTKAFEQYIDISNSPYQTQEFNVVHRRISGVRGDIRYNEVKDLKGE